MNTFIDVAHRSSLNAHPAKNFNDTKPQPSIQKPQTPINQQSIITNHTKVQPITNSNSNKNSGRRKHQTYQTNGKKRNFTGAQNNNNNNNNIRTNGNINANNTNSASVNIGVSNNGASDGRNCRRLNSNRINNNVSTDLYTNKEEQYQIQDSFNATNSTNTTSGISSNCSESSCDSTKSHKSQKLNLKANAMDIRSTRLIITHPTAQQSPAPISLLSPNAKTIYSLDYLHQVGAQLSDRFRTQPGEFYNGSNGNSQPNHSAYGNNGYRYNTNGANSMSTSSHVSDTSISPPLSITSSGSSNNSGKSNRSSKSGNRISNRNFSGSSSSMNNHRNIASTQTLQQPQPQPQLSFFQSQNIPFFHSSSSNGMQQMFAPNLSPNNHSQQPNHSNGIYIQPNSASTFHSNNNYHSHNRNYNSGGNKKSWNAYNNRFSKNKVELNGNYNNSGGSVNPSDNNKPNLNNKSTTTAPVYSSRKDSMPPNEKQIQTDKAVNKKSSSKDSDIESPTLSLKTFSLSDSETSNPKLKMPSSDFFRFPKAKSSSCTSSLSLSTPATSASTPTFLLNGGTSSIANRTVSHPVLLSIDNDSITTTKLNIQTESNSQLSRSKSEKSPVFNFSYGGRPNYSSSTNFVNPGSMLTEEMLLNGTNSNRIRYMTGQQNVQLLTEPTFCAPTYAPSDYFANSPIRSKSFVNGQQNKRRSSTPNNRTSINSIASVNLNNSRKQDECETQRATQYRSRINEVKVTLNDLCNGSDWDTLSQKIWSKYESRRQPQELYEKKTHLWTYLCDKIKTIFSRYSLYLVGSTISGFALDSSDVDMCLVSRLSTTLDPRGEAVYHLDKLRTHLQENYQTFLKNFNLIPAKVPILRFDDTIHNVEVDLNYNNCVGIRNSHLLHCYTQLDWRLQPLAVIVKLWAQHHDINNAKDLTISSYSLILMVIHYLQCGVQPAILPCLHAMYPDKFKKINDIDTINMNEKIEPYHSDNHQTLGELFHGFLQYYCHFNFEKHAISIRTAGLLSIDECRNDKSYKNDPNEWKQLCIEEPFDRSNTARSCCDEKIFERIKKVFYESWLLLGETKDLDALFGDPLAPPAFNAIYDNYIQTPLTLPHMEYMLR